MNHTYIYILNLGLVLFFCLIKKLKYSILLCYGNLLMLMTITAVIRGANNDKIREKNKNTYILLMWFSVSTSIEMTVEIFIIFK